MATYNHNQLKKGLKVMIDGDPFNIVETDFVKPGKGQAFTRIKVKNLLNGRVVEKTYKASENLEGADVHETSMQYLYSDGNHWHFMVPETFEQHAAGEAAVGDSGQWIKEQDICNVTLWNGQPISVVPPKFVTLTVTETDPGLKGDTSSGGTKPATLETGAVVRVPLFIGEGEVIRIDTESGEYVSRAKD